MKQVLYLHSLLVKIRVLVTRLEGKRLENSSDDKLEGEERKRGRGGRVAKIIYILMPRTFDIENFNSENKNPS